MVGGDFCSKGDAGGYRGGVLEGCLWPLTACRGGLVHAFVLYFEGVASGHAGLVRGRRQDCCSGISRGRGPGDNPCEGLSDRAEAGRSEHVIITAIADW